VTKPLIAVGTIVIAFAVSAIAYHYSKLNQGWLKPFYAAAIAYAIVLFIAMIIIVMLDRLGLYPN
jgi:hypothetical protein